ncbi:Gfo/Idh/MocA family protein [Candidatus Pelagisphaera phototrophica]|uniref:Gfo/Idh/MocA family protein n=1 Tax=Candidatus Pelagisphaera phototrophica TaxID=2684113 RepID=UPI0019FCC5FD|nr:Gfo/Idh/MocA family oxidoreductase [Candidatus Pelagisphaera phototrophica]QXD30698.1 Gfo/Idh/MocA family oxidoreductase [Candidatus Pelagisphaera phototrophica]
MIIDPISRRKFIKTTGAASVASLLVGAQNLHAAGANDKIRIGLIGLGGRGCRAGIIDCAEADSNIELVAMGDLFPDHLEDAKERIRQSMAKRNLPFKDIYKVTTDTMFSGFDAYKKVIACDVDLIILTTPPVFRPLHFKAAVEAGKHVFIEKPVAVDPVGVRDIINTSKLAEAKGLTVVAGTQMRRARHIMAGIEQIREGAMGDILSGQSTRIGGALSNWRQSEAIRSKSWSDMEWQLRRWLFTTWGSGDFIVEQHVHNLDLVDWVMGSHPVKAIGTGGRQNRTDSIYPNVWDHVSVEYEYANGARVTHIGSQIDGVSSRNDMRIDGTEGRLFLSFAKVTIEGKKPFKYDGPRPNPAVQEYKDTLDAIRSGNTINEGKRIAQSTMTAILGRMAAYTGRNLSWDWAMNASKLDLTPKEWKFGDHAIAPVAVPGVTKLV